MTVQELCDALKLEVLVDAAPDRKVTGGYCGDLLSWVMGRAPADCAWFTVMGNVNAIAVAVLADVSCIVLVEDASLDEDARRKAEAQGVPVLRSGKDAYSLSLLLGAALDEDAG